MPNPMDASNLTDNAVFEDVWNEINSTISPSIFSVDNTIKQIDADADHLFLSSRRSRLKHAQIEPDVFNLTMSIEEEF